MTAEQISALGIVLGVIGYLLMFFVSWRRAGHQNAGDDSGAMKATNEAAALAAEARLRAEKEAAAAIAECDEWREKYETLKRQLQSMKFKVELVVTDGLEPRAEVAGVQRIVAP